MHDCIFDNISRSGPAPYLPYLHAHAQHCIQGLQLGVHERFSRLIFPPTNPWLPCNIVLKIGEEPRAHKPSKEPIDLHHPHRLTQETVS